MFCLLFGASTRLVVVLLIAFCPIFFSGWLCQQNRPEIKGFGEVKKNVIFWLGTMCLARKSTVLPDPLPN
jgi:hypothetical protein